MPSHERGAPAREVFRIVHEPRLPEDFKSYAELEKAPNAPLCKRLSLSVFNSRLAACHQAGKYPSLGDHVGRGALGEGMGKVSIPSATGHLEWWPPRDFDRSAVFDEVLPCR